MAIALVIVALTIVALTIAVAPAIAQTYPVKQVRVMVGFSAGGGNDIVARIVAAKLSEAWGVAVVTDNRPGAGSNIAADIVAKAPADGYTLLICNTASHGINPAIYKNIPFDPVKDFTPVSQIGATPSVFLVHPSSQMSTVASLIAYARLHPGKLSVATSGIGTSQHLALELLKSMTGTNIVHVPYKGAAPALADLVGGQVQATAVSLPSAMQAIKSGRVRAVGVTTAKRSPQLPDLPTIAESGVPGFEVTTWTGMCAPAGVPNAIVAKLSADLVKVLNLPDTQQRLTEQGMDVVATTPAVFGDFIKGEVAKWANVAKAAGITPE